MLSNGNNLQELEDYGSMERWKSSTYSETKWANKSIPELTTFEGFQIIQSIFAEFCCVIKFFLDFVDRTKQKRRKDDNIKSIHPKKRKKGGWTRHDFKENSILISFLTSFLLLPS